MAHSPIGSEWASYAGSALPFLLPSATTKAISRFWPPVPAPGADTATAICLWALRSPHGTPIMALLYVMALIPVRMSLAVFTPTFRSLLNLVTLAMKFVNRVRMTVAFLLTPAPIPTPRALTLSRK